MSAMTLRLPDEMSDKVTKAADVLEKSVTDCIRDLVDEWLEGLPDDPEFMERLEASLNKTQSMFTKESTPKETKKGAKD